MKQLIQNLLPEADGLTTHLVQSLCIVTSAFLFIVIATVVLSCIIDRFQERVGKDPFYL